MGGVDSEAKKTSAIRLTIMTKINTNEVLDNARQFGLPLLVILLVTLVLVLDGMDIQIISFAAPLLTREFHVTPASLGPVLAAALIGMAVGGFVLGTLGDRWGRRPTLLVSAALFSLATMLCATAHSISVLIEWRFLTGLGLGGAVPNAMALLAEFTGPRWRTQAIAVAGVGVPIGGIIGALIASLVLPVFGWRPLFVVGGLAPMAVLAAMIFLLPESPRFLATRPHRRESLVKLLNRLAGAKLYSINDEFELPDSAPKGRGGSFSIVTTESLWHDTFWLWVVFLTNMFAIFAIASWLPVILTGLGLTLTVAVHGSLTFNLVGVCGGLITAWMLRRWGSRKSAVVLAILGIISLIAVAKLLNDAAHAGTSPAVVPLFAMMGLVGFGMIGIQAAAYRLSTHIYPTIIRSSGIGWAAAFGRVGGILSSLIAGWVLAQVHGVGFFAMLCGIVALTLVGFIVIRKQLMPIAVGRASIGEMGDLEQ
jgi:MFS transporter, AAHS family, 4-hydroxybenzoate transporter